MFGNLRHMFGNFQACCKHRSLFLHFCHPFLHVSAKTVCHEAPQVHDITPCLFLAPCGPLLQVASWVSAALDPSVRLAFLDTDGIQPAAAAEDSIAPGGGVVNIGEFAALRRSGVALL